MRWLDGITDSYGRQFEWAPGVGDGQGSLVCCSPWGGEELEPTEQLNWTESFSWFKKKLHLETSAQVQLPVYVD